MITAYVESSFGGRMFKVHGVVNRGGWFGKTWVIGIGMGFDTSIFVVEADSAEDAIDTFVDSRYGHLIALSEEENEERDEDYREYAGNYSTPVDLDDVRILEQCKVNYFAKKDAIEQFEIKQEKLRKEKERVKKDQELRKRLSQQVVDDFRKQTEMVLFEEENGNKKSRR